MNVLMRWRTLGSRRSTSTEMKKPKTTYRMVILGFFLSKVNMVSADNLVYLSFSHNHLTKSVNRCVLKIFKNFGRIFLIVLNFFGCFCN